MAKFPTPVQNVVVLVLENRSFDHMLGYLGTPNGLKGDEFNLEDPSSPGSTRVPVSNTAEYVGDLDVDPSHEVAHVTVQLFGSETVPPAGAPHNIGFVLDYTGQGSPQPHNIMKSFDPAKLPVLTTLAREFAVCDRWHASVPGQTWPNRFFLHCATSGGWADNDLHGYTMPTIYENLTGAGFDWAVYFHDIAQSLALDNLTDTVFKDKFKLFPEFFNDLKSHRLPNYCFLEPRYFDFLSWKANDQHPPHDVQLGEQLIADVYEQLRASDYWDKALLVILHDEHGGIYDHVLPPATVSPDGLNHQGFDFTRLGLRVPAVLVSPYIVKGTVESTTVYDHTSLLATVKDIFSLPRFLTKRDAQAATFTKLVDNPMRADADTPRTLSRPGDPVAGAFHAIAGAATMTAEKVVEQLGTGQKSVQALSEFQASLVGLANTLDVQDSARMRVLRLARSIDDEHDAAVHVREVTTQFVESALRAL
jgi:phospholipase C